MVEVNKGTIMQLGIAVLWITLLSSNVIHYLANKEIIPLFPKHIVLLGFLLFAWGFFSREVQIKKVNVGFIYTNIAGIMLALFFYLLLFLSDRYIDHAAATDELGISLFYAVCMMSLTIFSRSSIYPIAEKLLLGVLVVGIGLNLFDFIGSNTEIFSSIAGRASGLYVNPNISGFVLSASYILLHRSIPKSFRLVIFVLFVAAVITTASRASLLYVLLIILYLLVTGYFFIWTRRAVFVNSVLVICAAIYWVSFQQGASMVLGEISTVNRAFEQRMGHFQSILEGDESSLEVKEDGRFTLLVGHARLYWESPILGNGLGFSRSEQLTGLDQGSHNVYIHMLNEYGIIGLLFYLFFLFKAFGGRALRLHNTNFEPHLLMLILLAAGFFSHNLNRFYSVAIILAFAGAKYRVFGKHSVRSHLK